MSVKNSNDTIGNRTHDFPTCSVVPQPTALPRAPDEGDSKKKWFQPTRYRNFYKPEFHKTNHHLHETLDPSKAFPVSICFGEYIN